MIPRVFLKILFLFFTEDLPVDVVWQPYTDFYLQAGHSLHALLQIRFILTTNKNMIDST